MLLVKRFTGSVHPGEGRAEPNMRADENLMAKFETLLGWLPVPGTINLFFSRPLPWADFKLAGKVHVWSVYRAWYGLQSIAAIRRDGTTQPEYVAEVIAPRRIGGLAIGDRFTITFPGD
jgi:hypothetical protein